MTQEKLENRESDSSVDLYGLESFLELLPENREVKLFSESPLHWISHMFTTTQW